MSCHEFSNDFKTSDALYNLISNANKEQEAVESVAKEDELKALSKAIRECIVNDPTRPYIIFKQFSEDHKKVSLSLPNKNETSASDAAKENDVTLDVYLSGTVFKFKYELRFADYLEDDSKALVVLGKLETVKDSEDCEHKISKVLYEKFVAFCEEFSKVNNVMVFNKIHQQWGEMATAMITEMYKNMNKK